MIIEDSRLVIQDLFTQKLPNDVSLNHILRKIKLLLHKFKAVSFFHILWALNAMADFEANKGSLLGKGVLSVNGIEIQTNIP